MFVSSFTSLYPPGTTILIKVLKNQYISSFYEFLPELLPSVSTIMSELFLFTSRHKPKPYQLFNMLADLLHACL